MELLVLGFFALITLFCLGYLFLANDKERQALALNVVVGTISALVGYIAGKQSN